jgi:ubiquinone/menaquinone biosynthesis C-methylase UbiE
MSNKPNVKIADYQDTDYEQGFWGERQYEDLIEQAMIRRLIQGPYASLIDVGGGFGRLIPSYISAVKERSVLFDYSQKLLDSAKLRYRNEPRFEAVQGSFYEMPIEKHVFDAAISIRVIHHVEDVATYLKEINRVLKPGATFILEYANKRNWLEIVRRVLGRSKLHPFSLAPENRSVSGLTINFHPRYLKRMLKWNGFIIEKQVASSLLRSPILKRLVGQKMMAKMENSIPLWIRPFAITPSVFLVLRKVKDA